jgi:DNA polymerase/3'-5' exonuclease PolX
MEGEIMASGNKYQYTQAREIAEMLVQAMAPFSDRIEIAGSLRRKKPLVSDIEICVIPKWESRPDTSSLFGEQLQINLLHEWALQEKLFHWIKPGEIDLVDLIIKRDAGRLVNWEIRPDGNYWRGLLPENIKLDLFVTSPECWAQIFTIRTGSAEFSHALMTYAKHKRTTPFINGRVTNYGRPVDLKEEKDLFEYLQLRYVAPEDRVDGSVLREK